MQPRLATVRLTAGVRALCLGMIIGLASQPAAAAPPRVVAAAPEVGDADVDPALTELRIEFDQDMDTRGGMSVCGGGAEFPKITGKARWESPRVIIIPIAVEPQHRYMLSINCATARGFRSAAGEAAQITPLSFTTARSTTDARPSEPATPASNRAAIEALRSALNDRYSHRDVRLVDWNAELSNHAAQLETIGTRGAFARAVAAVLAPARDVHLSVRVGDARLATFSPMQPPNSNIALLERLVPGWKDEGGGVFTGRFEDGVLYILITSWPGDATMVQPAIDFLARHRESPGVIVDVRPNSGGDELTARRVASFFVDERAVYSRNAYRDPDSPTGWTAEVERTIEPAGDEARYRGPVAVLMGPACMSSNESFLHMMRTCSRVLLIGETSYGSSANPKPVDLGNGVTVLLPSWRDIMPDGTPLEGRGIPPDIGVRCTPDDLKTTDPVLEVALRAVRRR